MTPFMIDPLLVAVGVIGFGYIGYMIYDFIKMIRKDRKNEVKQK